MAIIVPSIVLSTHVYGADLITSTPIIFEQVPQSAQALVDKTSFDASKLQIEGTTFFLLTRKTGGLGLSRISIAIQTGWPLLHRALQVNIPEATIIDFDAAFGGGPMGKFIVGVFTTNSISPDFGHVIESATGWSPLQSSQEYIDKYYGDFADPTQAYANDIVIHELGHLVFGFGLTQVPDLKDKDSWFCLGLGLVYDRLAWSELSSKASPLFNSIVGVWKNRFSVRPDVDQRLINPDVTNDDSLGLQRLQTYGHGKALVFLNELRNKLGPSLFDSAVLKYVSRSLSSKISYDDFLTQFDPNQASLIKEIEANFKVR